MKVKYNFSSRRTRKIDAHNKHRQEYPELAKEVVRTSEIVLEILDARFISETRNKELEEFAKEQNKKIIFVVNKVDLIDIRELKKSGFLKSILPYVLVSCVKFVGRKRLRDLLKIEGKRFSQVEKDISEDEVHLQRVKQGIGARRHLKVESSIHIGIIGYPNVGKSSLINMLTGRSSARTSPRAGFTRGIQKISFSPSITLLDTPGVMTEEDASAAQRAHLKKHATIGVRTYDSTKHPDFVVGEIMRDNPGLLENYYNINANGDCEILIEELGRKLKFLRKGNQVDIDRTARTILKDWQQGKIAKHN